jgi:pullulanase
LRAAHPSLRSPNYFPAANQGGYGVFTDIGVVVYHRYGPADDSSFERFIIVLNYSDSDSFVDVPFSINGMWQELLNGALVTVQNFVLPHILISSNWGKIYFNKTSPVRS